MANYGFDVDKHVENKSDAEIFRESRLDRDGLEQSQWPSQIDRAALDVQYDIAIGKTDDETDIGGTIGEFNFHWATGEFYVDGLQSMAGRDGSVSAVLETYDPEKVGKLAYRLNEFRHELETTGQSMDIDRAIEALVEKQATDAIQQSVKRDGNAGAGLRQLRNTGSVSELTLKLFSDPRVDAYAQALIDRLSDRKKSDELLWLLDEPAMTTPLWDHQKRALGEWADHDQQGYVNMATATGKTVLGLAAIAYRYGRLHPADTGGEDGLPPQYDRNGGDIDDPTVLIVAGNELLLKQWRDEFDEHLDIPRSRTEPVDSEDGALIELGWGDVVFRTAQSLLEEPSLSQYDLVILDEAHRYSRGSDSGRGWKDLFSGLTEQSDAILAMSGSIDGGWSGDNSAREALENYLEECINFGVPEARSQGVIADFSWQVRYAAPDSDDEQKLAAQTRVTSANYDATTGTLDTDALGVPAEKVPSPFRTYTDIRSFVQSNAGNQLREQSDPFDVFASALQARQPIRWNTSPDRAAVANLVARHAPDQQTVVLVGSYDDATALGDCLVDEYGFNDDEVIVLENSRDDRHDKIETFNELERGVIVGPGDLLGVGIDLPEAEVAVNVAKGGVNPSLVQRIGRVLRNPSGDKEARFYHVVPQPTAPDARHDVEDGARLLREAAEYYHLGSTFKQRPTFAAADDSVESTLVDLENAGVQLLERVDDTDALVDNYQAREHVRRLQSRIYDAQSEGERSRSVLTSEWGHTGADGTHGTEPMDDGTDQFPERNEAYEQYRLSLGPYRAGKRVATNVLGSSFEVVETDDRYRIELDDEYEGTAFHEEFERWLNKYRMWRDRCDNRDGDGEPGSLPLYKEEWPSPPDTDGAMLVPEAAAEIHVDYANADPIFFPHTDEGVYSLPLPDGRRLTVEGIVEADHDTFAFVGEETSDKAVEKNDNSVEPDEEQSTSENQFEVSLAVIEAVRASNSEGSMPETFATAVSDALASWLDGDTLPEVDRSRTPRETIRVPVSERYRRMLDVVVEESERHASPSEVVEAAVCSRLDVDLDGTETYTVSFDTATAILLESHVAKDDEVDTVEAFIKMSIIEEYFERQR